jgi:hypothetical protein
MEVPAAAGRHQRHNAARSAMAAARWHDADRHPAEDPVHDRRRAQQLMKSEIRERTENYIHARHQHPAWQLLAAQRAPLVLSCLRSVFEQSQDGVDFDSALQSLADLLAEHANLPEFEVGEQEPAVLARKELRRWIKRGLVVEREGRLYATDALEEALRFVDALGGRIMTSTASRLSVIGDLEARLNPDPEQRARHIRAKITELERELTAVSLGRVDVLSAEQAVEGIREVFVLASGLRADFRRVEDSWREADRQLRHAIINEQSDRGSIVDQLLDGYDVLRQTAEGRVFHGFHDQLSQTHELDAMKRSLRGILNHPAASRALNGAQQAELRWLVMRLVKESAGVVRARSRSEKDVRSFLRSGLAKEHHRVGHLLNELFREALNVDWKRAAICRRPSPLPPLAIANANLSLVDRLRFKSLDQEARRELQLRRQAGDLDNVDADFWSSFDMLDREALLQATLQLLQTAPEPLGIRQLAHALPPTHDLETLALWLSMAREADLPVGPAQEYVELEVTDAGLLRFELPQVALSAAALEGIRWEL